MKYILRKNCIIAGHKNLEHLYIFKNFPSYMGCISSLDSKKDIKADMIFGICRDCGIIQLDKLLPLDIVYQNEHTEGAGLLWKKHYNSFLKFLKKFKVKNILEIGGGNGLIALLYTNNSPDAIWTIVEPNPIFKGNKKIKVIKSWFNEKFKAKENIDSVVSSHVIEHMYNPDIFIKQIYNLLKKGGKHIFSVPNLHKLLLNKYLNCLNFEHTIFLTEYFLDYFLKKNGFKIIEKEYFLEHSIFYATEKSDKDLNLQSVSKYVEYKNVFNEFINYYKVLINNINDLIKEIDYEIFLFGAHIFSLYLIGFGLKKEKIAGVLDNSSLKQGKRLYGTGFQVYSPDIIKNKKEVAVILKADGHQQEIRKQLLSLNKNVTILE